MQAKLLSQAKRAQGLTNRGSQGLLDEEALQWKQRCQDQHNIIKELIGKMAGYGIEVTEEELMEMQHQGVDQDPAQQTEYGQAQGQIKAGASMDLIVSFSPSRGKEAITKQLQGAYF